MSEPLPGALVIDVRTAYGWNPTDPVTLALTPGFAGSIETIARDLIRKTVSERLRLEHDLLERAESNIVEQRALVLPWPVDVTDHRTKISDFKQGA